MKSKDFWDNQSVITSQDRTKPQSFGYEMYLYEKTAKHLNGKFNNLKAKIFGCGTGREIPEIIKYINVKTVVASDFATNMIKKCNENLLNWDISDKVTTIVQDAALFSANENSFELVTIMNNMLNYVINSADRDAIFQTSNSILVPNGVLIGVVHNQVGTPQKTIYFALRKLIKPFLSNEVGYRKTGFNNFKFDGYYFTKKELFKLLEKSNFKNIEIISISQFYKLNNLPYNRLKGYNNLLFFATK